MTEAPLSVVPTTAWWIGFNSLILVLLALDLGVFNRKAHSVSVKEALGWSAVWVSLAIGFGLWIRSAMGQQAMLEFYAGYLVEQALSVDNLFVFILIFSYFKIPPTLQHRVLFWGILGALIMRGMMIGAGAALLSRFHWIIYVFGAFLVYTGVKLALPKKEDGFEPEKNPAVKLARRFIPVTNHFEGGRFFTRVGGRLHATPMFLVLLIVETTDVMFALDSIPAVIAITRNEFIVFTSNIFAILGLRSLYFAVAGIMQLFRYLNIGLAVILCFVGVKMIVSHYYPIDIRISLGIIGTVLAASILASVLIPQNRQPE